MILVKGKAGKGEGGKEVFPFFSLPLSDPPPASSAHSDQRMRGSENQQFGNNCRPKRLSPSSLSLSLSLCRIVHAFTRSSSPPGWSEDGEAAEWGSKRASMRPGCRARAVQQEPGGFPPPLYAAAIGGRRRRMGWSAHYVAAGSREAGGRERGCGATGGGGGGRENKQAAGKPK